MASLNVFEIDIMKKSSPINLKFTFLPLSKSKFSLQDKYQGKLHGLIIITMTKEEFDQYDKDNDEILTFNEWMSADA